MSSELIPDIVISDVSLSFDLPKEYILSILYQSFSNAIESILSPKSSIFSSSLSLSALRIYHEDLVDFYYGNENLRENLIQASLLISSAVSNTFLGLSRVLVNKMLFAFEDKKNLTCIKLNACTLYRTMQYNLNDLEGIDNSLLFKFSKIADSLSLNERTLDSKAKAICDYIANLNKKLSLSCDIYSLISKDEIDSKKLTIGFNSSLDPFLRTNTKIMNLKEISYFLENLL